MFLFRGAGRNPPPTPRAVSAECLRDRRGFLRGLVLLLALSAPTASLPAPMPRPGDDDRDDMALYVVDVVPTDGAEVPRPKDHATELVPVVGRPSETSCKLDGLQPGLLSDKLLMPCAAMLAVGKSEGSDWVVR